MADINLDKLLEKFDQITHGEISADRALYNLLVAYKEYLPKEVDDYFHKCFRQTNVTPIGKVDVAIWILLDVSTKFWEVFNRLEEDPKDKLADIESKKSGDNNAPTKV